jgi:hypothetical protein
MPILVRFLFLPLLLVAALARAGDIPDLRGLWRTTAHEGITTGSRHFPKADAAPQYVSGQFTMEITEQDGRRFMGVKRSSRHEERFMGVIGYDGATVHILEDEGTFHGRLLPDGTMELIYSHDAGPSKAIGIALYARVPK